MDRAKDHDLHREQDRLIAEFEAAAALGSSGSWSSRSPSPDAGTSPAGVDATGTVEGPTLLVPPPGQRRPSDVSSGWCSSSGPPGPVHDGLLHVPGAGDDDRTQTTFTGEPETDRREEPGVPGRHAATLALERSSDPTFSSSSSASGISSGVAAGGTRAPSLMPTPQHPSPPKPLTAATPSPQQHPHELASFRAFDDGNDDSHEHTARPDDLLVAQGVLAELRRSASPASDQHAQAERDRGAIANAGRGPTVLPFTLRSIRSGGESTSDAGLSEVAPLSPAQMADLLSFSGRSAHLMAESPVGSPQALLPDHAEFLRSLERAQRGPSTPGHHPLPSGRHSGSSGSSGSGEPPSLTPEDYARLIALRAQVDAEAGGAAVPGVYRKSFTAQVARGSLLAEVLGSPARGRGPSVASSCGSDALTCGSDAALSEQRPASAMEDQMRAMVAAARAVGLRAAEDHGRSVIEAAEVAAWEETAARARHVSLLEARAWDLLLLHHRRTLPEEVRIPSPPRVLGAAPHPVVLRPGDADPFGGTRRRHTYGEGSFSPRRRRGDGAASPSMERFEPLPTPSSSSSSSSCPSPCGPRAESPGPAAVLLMEDDAAERDLAERQRRRREEAGVTPQGGTAAGMGAAGAAACDDGYSGASPVGALSPHSPVPPSGTAHHHPRVVHGSGSSPAPAPLHDGEDFTGPGAWAGLMTPPPTHFRRGSDVSLLGEEQQPGELQASTPLGHPFPASRRTSATTTPVREDLMAPRPLLRPHGEGAPGEVREVAVQRRVSLELQRERGDGALLPGGAAGASRRGSIKAPAAGLKPIAQRGRQLSVQEAASLAQLGIDQAALKPRSAPPEQQAMDVPRSRHGSFSSAASAAVTPRSCVSQNCTPAPTPPPQPQPASNHGRHAPLGQPDLPRPSPPVTPPHPLTNTAPAPAAFQPSTSAHRRGITVQPHPPPSTSRARRTSAAPATTEPAFHVGARRVSAPVAASPPHHTARH